MTSFNYQEWTSEQELYLDAAWFDGCTMEEIGDELGRTRNSIASKIKALGIQKQDWTTEQLLSIGKQMGPNGAIKDV